MCTKRNGVEIEFYAFPAFMPMMMAAIKTAQPTIVLSTATSLAWWKMEIW